MIGQFVLLGCSMILVRCTLISSSLVWTLFVLLHTFEPNFQLHTTLFDVLFDSWSRNSSKAHVSILESYGMNSLHSLRQMKVHLIMGCLKQHSGNGSTIFMPIPNYGIAVWWTSEAIRDSPEGKDNLLFLNWKTHVWKTCNPSLHCHLKKSKASLIVTRSISLGWRAISHRVTEARILA